MYLSAFSAFAGIAEIRPIKAQSSRNPMPNKICPATCTDVSLAFSNGQLDRCGYLLQMQNSVNVFSSKCPEAFDSSVFNKITRTLICWIVENCHGLSSHVPLGILFNPTNPQVFIHKWETKYITSPWGYFQYSLTFLL